MICDECKKETHRLIGDSEGISCPDCKRKKRTGISIDAIIGRVKFNKWGVRMTVADAERIKTNRKRADGQYRPDPRWR